MFRISVAAVCSLAIFAVGSPAHATNGDVTTPNVTSQALIADGSLTPLRTGSASTVADNAVFPVTVVLTGSAGVSVLDGNSSQTYAELLATHGLTPDLFRTSQNAAVNGTAKVTATSPVFLFELEYKGATTRIKLPAPTIEKKTATLPRGETMIEANGRKGVALKTSVTTTSSAQNKAVNAAAGVAAAPVVEETLTIVRAPKPKIILVGTAELPSEDSGDDSYDSPAPQQQGVDAPQQTVDPSDMRMLEKLNKDNPVVLAALSKVGSPYVWGATGPAAFDCSGLVLWAFGENGYGGLPRTSTAQGNYAEPVAWSAIKRGDIVWRPGHIGIYAGGGLVVHAANPGKGVVVASLDWFTSSGFKVGRLPKP